MTSKPWTTKEIQDAKRVYYTGGSAAVVKLLPHRTRAAIQTQAQLGKWPIWTTINEGTIASKIVAAASIGPVTAYDVASDMGVNIKSISAIMCQLFKREVLFRKRVDAPSSNNAITFEYTVNPKWTEATKQ